MEGGEGNHRVVIAKISRVIRSMELKGFPLSWGEGEMHLASCTSVARYLRFFSFFINCPLFPTIISADNWRREEEGSEETFR